MAESKVRFFEEKYHTSLVKLEEKGLPDDADHEMHEDYIMWHHWTEAVQEASKQVSALQAKRNMGLSWDHLDVGN